MEELADAEVVFGSRFPEDLEYTQIMRNINRIRLCMDRGKRVVLLNLESLYESLYDLLNQAYQESRGDFYVEIGLGSHRHRSRVHPNFRLVVVAEMDEVRRCFPAALVNRLEKLAVFPYTDLGRMERDLAASLHEWAERVVRPGAGGQKLQVEDVFVGYSKDTSYALARDLEAERGQGGSQTSQEGRERELRERLMQTCVPEGVLRMAQNGGMDASWAMESYFLNSFHSSLQQLLPPWLKLPPAQQPMLQITTYQSEVLSEDQDGPSILAALSDITPSISLRILQLNDFRTESTFEAQLKAIFQAKGRQLLLLQCRAAQEHPKLVAASRYKYRCSILCSLCLFVCLFVCLSLLLLARLEELRKTHPEAEVNVALLLTLHRLPFYLTDRIQKWVESDLEKILQVSSHKALSEGPELEAVAVAAGLRDSQGRHPPRQEPRAGPHADGGASSGASRGRPAASRRPVLPHRAPTAGQDRRRRSLPPRPRARQAPRPRQGRQGRPPHHPPHHLQLPRTPLAQLAPRLTHPRAHRPSLRPCAAWTPAVLPPHPASAPSTSCPASSSRHVFFSSSWLASEHPGIVLEVRG